QLPQDARRGACGAAAALLLEGRHARLHRGRARDAKRRCARVLHDRCRAAAQGRLFARGPGAGRRAARRGARRARRDHAGPGARPRGTQDRVMTAAVELGLEHVARAPGKAVVLGEYAVLEGAPALVLAVDRYCTASIRSVPGETSSIETRFPDPMRSAAPIGRDTGVALVDLVRRVLGGERAAWRASLDSSDFYVAGSKLGLGSSAAALVAFAGAWAARAGLPRPTLAQAIELHRRFQPGAGSGLDVAASLTGGVIEFRLDAGRMPHVGSVQLPKGVGFAGIFAGRSAATPDLLARYHAWRAEKPGEAADRQRTMERIAESG